MGCSVDGCKALRGQRFRPPACPILDRVDDRLVVDEPRMDADPSHSWSGDPVTRLATRAKSCRKSSSIVALHSRHPAPSPVDRLERLEIAARIRGLVAIQGEDDVAEIARRLRVSELALRMSIDPDSPQPTIEVMLAVVRDYGVDPSWLLRGVYDPKTHHESLQDSHDGAAAALRRVSETPPSSSLPINPAARSST
jgi:hypothetical protein